MYNLKISKTLLHNIFIYSYLLGESEAGCQDMPLFIVSYLNVKQRACLKTRFTFHTGQAMACLV